MGSNTWQFRPWMLWMTSGISCRFRPTTGGRSGLWVGPDRRGSGIGFLIYFDRGLWPATSICLVYWGLPLKRRNRSNPS